MSHVMHLTNETHPVLLVNKFCIFNVKIHITFRITQGRVVRILEFDYSKLKGKIKEVFETQSAFGAAMGMSSVTTSAKLNNQVTFSQDEINLACKLLNIPVEFIPIYFFTEKVKTS